LYRFGTFVAGVVPDATAGVDDPLDGGVSPSEKYVLVNPASKYVTLKSIVRLPSRSRPSSSLWKYKIEIKSGPHLVKLLGVYIVNSARRLHT